uniref:protein GREB1-like isoform X2 n=1 Tax=Oncorhynchus gorbuscha TaxID=8017 RepID=UPI001EAF392E|nr:protein GREB1-like isoform X2 [Oncorhynchus gorbuscha]
MGNSYAGQLRSTRFEEVLHNSIEASLRSNTVVPRPVFSQLYLEAKQPTLHNGRVENENEEEDGSESNSPPVPYKMKPSPEGCCTTDGFCHAGRDLRLSSLVSEPQDVPPGFQLVGALSAGTPDTLLVCAVDRRFLPDERECNALLGFSGNCIGCGEKGFRYFTEFSNHINLKLSTQPKKQKHLKYHLYRNNQGQLVRGAAICWKGLESRGRQTTQPNASDGHVTSDDHFPNPAVTAHPAHTPGNYTEPIAPPPLGNGSHIPLSQNPLPQTPILSKGPWRPTVIGTLNTGPLKKRHRGWSPAGAESAVKTPLSSSSSSSSLTNWTKPDNAPAVSLSQGSSNSPSPPGPSVTVPDQLLHTCRLQPIIFSGVLQNLGLEQDCLSQREAERYVVKMDQEARARIDDLIQEANRNPNTLFILVHDHAHWDMSSGGYAPSGGDSGSGLVDSLLNSCQIRDANNILILHVTSFPFALQTQHTRISPYNEIYWPSASNNEVDLYLEKTQYFGVCELLDSTRSGSGLPLLRYDSSIESMASVLEERFPKLHSAVIRTQVLIQHYCVAMMAVSGPSGSGGRSQHKHTSVETLEIVQSLLSAAQRCPSHHGHMVLLRLLSLALAGWAHQRLVWIRQRLGLGELFEIILGNPSQTLSIGQSFTERIKTWLKIQETDWVPRTYLELEALPCILILSGADPLGESLPRSLKYCDLRVISSSYLQRTALEQELGLAAYLVRVESQGSQPHGHAPGLGGDLSESDSDKLNSTDNEEKEGGENTLKSDLPGLGHSTPSVPHPPSVLQPSRTFPDSIAADPLHPHTTPQGPHRPPNTQRRPSKSTSLVSSSPLPPSLLQGCSWARGVSRPPSLLLPRGLYDIIKARDGSGLPRCTSFLPHRSVTWASSFRPLLSKMMTCIEQSLYYRQWTIPQPHHMDSSNRPAKGRTDNFHPRRLLLSGPPQVYTDIHTCRLLLSGPPQVYTDFHPRRLLLSGPPQVGKTGAYLQFLGILSRMLIRLMEVDIYDEEDINFSGQLERVQYQPTCASWPVTDTLRAIPFDYTVHDPKYEDISTVYCPGYYPNTDGIPRRQKDVYLRRRTARIKLSKYAAYNTYHHCEQCHQYTGFNPAYQMYELTLHAFTFSHLLLGEDIQLYFIIPKSKHHHFSFSQPGGQLESMRLPLTSDWNPDCIKSPIFTPTTGRHEHGLFNLYHAMDGAAHLHILVIKEYEMAVYKKYWPNHIMLVLPTIFNGAGLGAAHFLIKELSYNNLELERRRRVEGGGPPADVWPFIILSDDSCVMWNAVDLDSRSTSGHAERNVSLKQMLQHMEACPDLTQFGLCGIRKWSSHSPGQGSGGGDRHREPFSRGHLHDFLLLNVDLTQGIQFNQNRFTCDDVDFTLRVHSAGLLICRFNNFSVMKKQISVGGYHTFIIKNKMTDVPTSVQPSQYICAPDSKHPFLATPAQLLLEKYLQHSSLFPLSTCNYTHPILSVDCYLNLGPEVTVCFVSSRPHSINICTTGLLFSGLLLCFWDSFVTPGFLKNFHFLKGAVLCVICADRSSLRQTVVRLELEDEWRFRLSDEFQTANAKEDRPLFFLTGKHI